MKLYYITIILFIISIICVAIGLIIKNKKIRNTGFGIMIFIAVFWVAFFIWVICDMADEYERHFPDENNSNTILRDEINTAIIYDKDGNIIAELNKEDDNEEIIAESTLIQGIYYGGDEDYIYITQNYDVGNSKYFAIDEYDTANVIKNDSIVCIDYLTLEKYDESYIENGDILFCTGKLIKRNSYNFMELNSPITVLKNTDFQKMKQKALTDSTVIITVESLELNEECIGYIYLKYNIADTTNTDTFYPIPFICKAEITKETQINGTLTNGTWVDVTVEENVNLELGIPKIINIKSNNN